MTVFLEADWPVVTLPQSPNPVNKSGKVSLVDELSIILDKNTRHDAGGLLAC